MTLTMAREIEIDSMMVVFIQRIEQRCYLNYFLI